MHGQRSTPKEAMSSTRRPALACFESVRICTASPARNLERQQRCTVLVSSHLSHVKVASSGLPWFAPPPSTSTHRTALAPVGTVCMRAGCMCMHGGRPTHSLAD